jgi:hypothetical protein
MNRITALKFWAASVILIMLAGAAFGQSDGSITGQVKDSSGAAVAGATIKIVNPTNSVSRTATTDADGIFVAPQLPPGAYTISVEKQGFKRVEKGNVVLSALDKLNAGDFTLEVGQVTEAVQIQADAGQLQIKTESGERSDLITNRQVRNLALNGRNILDLTKTIPGVINTNQNAQSTVTNAAGTFTVNGARSNMHEVTVDGSTNLNTGNNSGLLVTVNPDALAEIKILTSNYQAEYGRAGGGFVQLTTRSGTNEYHGGGRYFRRHDSLNANSFFNNANRLSRNIYRYNFYGYDFSGPVPFIGEKDRRKLFFFFSQEYYRQVIPENARNIRVPTEAERNGDFSQTTDGNGAKIFIRDPLLSGACNATEQTACFRDAQGRLNVIPQNRFFNNGQAILNLYPTPNVTGRNDFNFTSQVSSKYPRREDILRMDYQINEKTRLSGRFIRNEDEQQFAYGTTSASWNWPLSFAARRNGPGYTFGFTLTNTFSPTLVNEFSYAPSRGAVTISVVDDKFTRAANNISAPLLFPDANNGDAIPNFNYGGIANQTFPTTGFNGSPFTQTFSLDNFIDNLTKVWGKHTVKTGFYWQRSHNKRTSFGPIQANINFANDSNNPLNTGHPFANALLGVYSSYEQASVQLTNDFVYNNIEVYIQDTWKVTPRLTLDYGLRLSYYQPLYDIERQLGLFDPALYDRSRAVRIYAPVCVNAVTCASGANRRAIDPAQLVPGFTPTTANTLPATFVGLIVPNSGDITNGVGSPDKSAPRGGYESDSVLWGPRFGFAFDLTGDQKTVIRGGFGMSYDRIRGDVTIDGITNPPNVLQPTLFFGRLDDIPGLRSSGGFRAIPNVIGVDRGGELPTVYTYSLSVQRNVGRSTAVDVAYVGALGRHLARQRNLNSLPYGTTFSRAAQDPTQFANGVIPNAQPNLPLAYSQAGINFTGQLALPVNFLRPLPGYGDINYRSFDANSNYNALQVSVNRRFTSRLTFGVAYTWSKALTTANDETENTHPFNSRGYDYKLFGSDRTHVFVANYVYDLPKIGRYLGDNRFARGVFDNWQISGITQFVSGTPLELGLNIAGVDAGQRITGAYSGGGLSGQQPRLSIKSDPSKGPNGLLVDPNAFVVPALGSIGPYPRTYLRNPGINNHDISIFKNFPLGGEGSRSLQLRFEFFNAFNHTQFSGINAGANLVVPGAPANASIFGTATDNAYNRVVITNNLRNGPVEGSNRPLGAFFGEYNNTREQRVIQLAMKVYF